MDPGGDPVLCVCIRHQAKSGVGEMRFRGISRGPHETPQTEASSVPGLDLDSEDLALPATCSLCWTSERVRTGQGALG